MVTDLDTELNCLHVNDEFSVEFDKLKREIGINRGFNKIEQAEKPVESQVIVDAIFEYFDKEINNTTLILKTGKFSQKEKENIKNIFNDYLSKHRFLVIGKDRKVKIEIDDKRALISTIKKIGKIIGKKISSKKYQGIRGKVVNIGIDIAGNRFIGNIENKLKEMDWKDYLDVIYGYVGCVIKIVLKRTNGIMTKGDLLTYFMNNFPNKNNEFIKNGIEKSGRLDENLTYGKYVGIHPENKKEK